MRSGLSFAAAAATVLLVACGEPAVGVEMPERPAGEHVADLAHVFGGRAHELNTRLVQIASDGPEIVALTYETDEATCGEAYRAARQFVEEWDADVAIVAVAAPGDFGSTADDRRRCVGVQPRDERAVPGGLREEIAEEIVPPEAADNEWTDAFLAAAEALAQQ